MCYNDFFVGNHRDTHFRQFHQLFGTFKPCCDAFNYYKSLIKINGTYLYNKYTGTLLISTTTDGNSNVLPLAFVIVERETLHACSWFLAHFPQHVSNRQGI
uniref:MULE transposase domain-containing protein n=1 Tax=Cajanus cajan TaxID=3821 RepID=A0A151RTX7_CAJCA|nr:hypothetical protein KK1_032438 [Cajanus cajan]